MMDQRRSGSTVLLFLSDAAQVEELGRIIAQAGNLANVKVVHIAELNGRKPTHIAVDEVDHLSFEVDSSLASVLDKMCERSPEDFRREYLGEFLPGGEPIADRLKDVPMAKSEFVVASESRGKWKGRRAIERGWRR
ncbi:MAG TPA: hypothetical protein VNQ80_15435 [Parapedobacter sp.]|uniref:hypothetical protein n=1 Tax=Parapedobacter sp. TaxID=1958893 RepID=UPI002C17220F|nr:hypothetical protein [Parapedobacter sp.]HWK58735.1 hypothetical protein [Parapedobacter sp.]